MNWKKINMDNLSRKELMEIIIIKQKIIEALIEEIRELGSGIYGWSN